MLLSKLSLWYLCCLLIQRVYFWISSFEDLIFKFLYCLSFSHGEGGGPTRLTSINSNFSDPTHELPKIGIGIKRIKSRTSMELNFIFNGTSYLLWSNIIHILLILYLMHVQEICTFACPFVCMSAKKSLGFQLHHSEPLIFFIAEYYFRILVRLAVLF